MPCSVSLVDLSLSRALPPSRPRPSLKLSPAQQAFVDAHRPSGSRMEEELPAGAVRMKSGGEGVMAGVMEARRRGVRVSAEDIGEERGGPMEGRRLMVGSGKRSRGSFKDVTEAAGAWMS
mmetsp:Transcript_49571/g.155288  ORF Transcript_49571/g.155288 Transcript_49571/m.155288 type:complete len:120 (-) Transcript_49571:129-488(-)